MGAALELSNRLPGEKVSRMKTPAYFGRPLNFCTTDGDEEFEAYELVEWPENLKNTHKESDIPFGEFIRDQFVRWHKESRIYTELGQLVNAIRALSEWRIAEDNCLQAKIDNKKVPSKRMKETYENVVTAMDPLLNAFLTHSVDGMCLSTLRRRRSSFSSISVLADLTHPAEEEASQLAIIRNAYLPDIVLAYNSAIQAAAHFISRENATKSMDLAIALAADANAELADAFVQTERMQELVRSLAATSQAMVKLNERAARGGSKKRGWLGESTRVWDLNVMN